MKSKEKELLLALYRSPHTYQTGTALASQLGISERTVRTYIRTLEHLIQNRGADIQAKQGSGYQLVVTSPALFEPFVSSLQKKKIDSKNADLDSVQDRQDYILSRLLLEDEHVILEDLCDLLFISRSTLAKDLTAIKELLRPYDLHLRSKTGFGTWVSGKESAKRAFMMDYFFRDAKLSSLREYMNHSGYFGDIPMETVIMIILEESGKGHLALSDVMIQNILLHICLSIKRIQKGQRVLQISEFDQVELTWEFSIAQNILNRLEKALSVHFPPEEAFYLTLHMGMKGANLFSSNPKRKQILESEIDDCLKLLDERTELPLSSSPNLRQALLEHILPMVLRLEQHIPQANPLTAEIVRDHPEALTLTRSVFSTMPSLSGFVISDDEWCYLVLHIMAALEQVSQKRKIQALVICATGVGSSQLLKNRIEKEFGDSIHIVSETGYFSMNDDILKGIDLIISSVNIGPVIFGVPFIHVSLFLNQEDVAKIREFISTRPVSPTIKDTVVRLQKARRTEIFDSYFNAESFMVFDEPMTRESAVRMMLGKLSQDEDDGFEKHMEDQIELRLKMGSVAFSDTIAVPHPAMPVSRKAQLAVGIAPDGVFWDEVNQDIRFVFLLSPSYIANEGSHHLLQGIVNLIDKPEVQKQMLKDPSYESFRDLFINSM